MRQSKGSRSNAKKRTGKRRSRRDRALVQQLLTKLKEGNDVRKRKARRVRAAIRVGVYENDLKFRIALERLVSSL
jgi:hypothetical protein